MKILLIVIFAVTSYVHCKEAEERSDKYSFDKINEISESSTKDFHPVKESINENSNLHKAYDEGLDTNRNTPNSHGQFISIPKTQSYQYINNLPSSYQLQGNPSYRFNVPYQVTYKSYPHTAKSFDYVPVKQNVPKQLSDFSNLPKSNYLTSYQMVAAIESKPFVPSPQIYVRNNAVFGSNSYGLNQYKFAEPYSYKPTTWTKINNGYKNGIFASGNGFEIAKGYSPVIATYGPASTNGNIFKTVKEYTPVYSRYGIPSSTTAYPAGNIRASSTYMSNEYRNPKMSYAQTNVGNGFKYTNVAQAAQYIKPEYKPAMVDGYGPEFLKQAITTKSPEFIPYAKQQYMYVAPKEYASIPSGPYGYNGQNFGNSFMNLPKSTNGYNAEYSSAPSFESSLRDIIKMVNEEQRKSNGKAIFLIGKPQFPPQMLTNPREYSAPSTQYGSQY